MKLKEKKHLGASAIKIPFANMNRIQVVSRHTRQQKPKPGIITKLTSMTVNHRASTSPVKMKKTAIQWMENYAWHGVFIISGLFWLAVMGFIWFLTSL
ncbi:MULTISPECIES: hypothetical protein [Serratia]|uniref:Uncharacterized protein n=1 Tax=Serratia quinivorans TaxID=137545 RepID=A0A380B1B3_9GAMM|nr:MULTISPECIES: hypothetical protein [Serratia]QBX65460.1 hypothetical protein E4343_04395 [Serratia quinivorans]RYM57336.1 hypothetical protein BSR03_26065 [Serratia proteamaculans]CAI0717256.1 Uncharacterised protein [Serratia quinivorans]CAI1650128.1 Uncharacterised protein [Serratia quinivorans]CAI1650592.1 Uncharacterised protein [Serratia quinivorans]